MGQSLLDSVAETQVRWIWMIKYEITENTIAEGINHFSVGTRKCLMEEVVFELNLEEWVKAYAHELRLGWKAHSRQRKKRTNKASHFTLSKTQLFVSPHTLFHVSILFIKVFCLSSFLWISPVTF